MKDAVALGGVILLLAVISFAAAAFCITHGYVLYYGDAEAHLNIARRVLDSRTPNGEQLGTVWLPLPHLLMIPFVMRDAWWRSGVAGTIPSALCFVLAGALLFAAGRRVYGSRSAASAVALLFALNPNMLYLQSTPMTEPLFAASLAGLVWATLWFRDSQSLIALFAMAAASNAASLTRYEGWFLIPFVSLYLLWIARNKWHAVLFGALAAFGPLAWLAHNQYYWNNALEFYNGPYSAMAIYRRQLAGGMAPYPGDHDWRTAAQYYFAAVRLTSGWPLLTLGAAGILATLWQPAFWKRGGVALFLLVLPPAFYLWSVHSSGTPIFVPHLWPNSWYNTRYGLAALPLAALSAGGPVTLAPARFRAATALLIVTCASVFWILPARTLPGRGPVSICWKESEVNSAARRAWTGEAAAYLAEHYQGGSGIIFSFGDLTGVLRQAGISLRDGLHQGNVPAWDSAVLRPDLFLRQEWALAFSGDEVSTAVLKARKHGPYYELKKQIIVKGAPVVEIYQRRPLLSE